MAKMVPRVTPNEEWKALTPKRAYAIRATSDDDIHLRFGPGGVYISIVNQPPNGRLINTLTIEEGEPTMIGRLKPDEAVIIGRGSECAIKIPHTIMSRQHLELRLDGNVLVVKDLGSTNGTYFFSENIVFDIEQYIESHPPEKAAEATMDEMHEAFGSALNDFLKRYQESKNKNS